MEKIQIFSNRVICCAQDDEYSDTYKAKFVICDFSANENTVAINRKKITKWMKTLVNKPLVGKIVSTVKGGMDFSGHNMRIIWKKDDNGNVYKDTVFDTYAFGTFTDVSIEKIDNVECIVATCEIWKRFQNACALIMKRVESGTLNTSWEITILDSHEEAQSGKSVKVIDDGVFTAHCLLGEKVKPAYGCSRLIEVAEANQDFDDELATAIGQDIDSFDESKVKEDVSVQKIVSNADTDTPEISTTVEAEVDTSACGKKKEKSEEKDPKDELKDGEKPVNNSKDEPEDDSKGDPEKDKKENGECAPDGKKKNETSEANEEKPENVQASMTSCDLARKIQEAVNKILDDAYVEFHFPVEKTIWVRKFRAESQLDYKRFTYDVVDDSVVLSAPEDVKLSVSVAEMNTKFCEMTDSIVAANAAIKAKDIEISELNTYKEKFEKVEQERISEEIAQKKNDLRQYAIASGLIQEIEVSECGELSDMIDANDEVGIKNVIADRFMASMNDSKKTVEHETSSAKQPQKKEVVKAGLNNVVYNEADVKDIMKSYLSK